jgi:hypothetical protein
MYGLLVGHDKEVAAWAFSTYQMKPMPVDAAIGIVDESGTLRGAALYQSYNGFNVEFSYYGRRTLTLGIIRSLARIAIVQFNPSRVSVSVNRRSRFLTHHLPKLGFKLEGAARCFYGYDDKARNTAIRFVLFRRQLNKMAYQFHTEKECEGF